MRKGKGSLLAPVPSVGVWAAKGARPGRSTGDSNSGDDAGMGAGGCGEKGEESCGENAVGWCCCVDSAAGDVRRLSSPIIEPKPSSLSRTPLAGLCTTTPMCVRHAQQELTCAFDDLLPNRLFHFLHQSIRLLTHGVI